jgi:hypothetical protein
LYREEGCWGWGERARSGRELATENTITKLSHRFLGKFFKLDKELYCMFANEFSNATEIPSELNIKKGPEFWFKKFILLISNAF